MQCFNAGQMDVPRNIPGDVRNLNLSRNSILAVRAGKLDNFRHLAVLDLSHNSITVSTKHIGFILSLIT